MNTPCPAPTYVQVPSTQLQSNDEAVGAGAVGLGVTGAGVAVGAGACASQVCKQAASDT